MPEGKEGYIGKRRNYGDLGTLLYEVLDVTTAPEWIGLTLWFPVVLTILYVYCVW